MIEDTKKQRGKERKRGKRRGKKRKKRKKKGKKEGISARYFDVLHSESCDMKHILPPGISVERALEFLVNGLDRGPGES